MKRLSRRLSPALLGSALILGAGLAAASLSGDARTRAESLLASLGRDPETARATRGSVEPAKHALRRADDARAAGDHPHAAKLENLALEHAESARDLARAMEAEKKLSAAQKELSEIEVKITRARALLEETVARRGRARAKLDQLEKAGTAAPPPAAPAVPSGAQRGPAKGGQK